jgi:hypothetical protein
MLPQEPEKELNCEQTVKSCNKYAARKVVGILRLTLLVENNGTCLDNIFEEAHLFVYYSFFLCISGRLLPGLTDGGEGGGGWGMVQMKRQKHDFFKYVPFMGTCIQPSLRMVELSSMMDSPFNHSTLVKT